MARAKNQFYVEGLDELLRDVARFEAEALPAIVPAVKDAGDLLLGETRRELADVTTERSGDLRRSLYTKEVVSEGASAISYLTWGDDVREYAAPLELGHALRRVKKGPEIGRAEAHPYLRPAADKNRKKVINIVRGGMNKALEMTFNKGR